MLPSIIVNNSNAYQTHMAMANTSFTKRTHMLMSLGSGDSDAPDVYGENVPVRLCAYAYFMCGSFVRLSAST